MRTSPSARKKNFHFFTTLSNTFPSSHDNDRPSEKLMQKDSSYPRGGDVTHSALILHSGTSIVIREPSPFFPCWGLGCAQALSGSEKRSVWSSGCTRQSGCCEVKSTCRGKHQSSCHSKVETKPSHLITSSVLWAYFTAEMQTFKPHGTSVEELVFSRDGTSLHWNLQIEGRTPRT